MISGAKTSCVVASFRIEFLANHRCRQLVVGTGKGALPVMDEVKLEAKRRKVSLLIRPTAEAIEVLKRLPEHTNAILHVTC